MYPNLLDKKPHGLEWQAVIDAQNAEYPRCRAHGTPTACVIGDEPVCLRCLQDDPSFLMWLKSGSLVSGGLK